MRWLALGVLAGTAVTAAWLARRLLLVVTVSGDSMRPAYRDGDTLLAVRRPALGLRAGRVVVAESPDRDTLTWPARPPTLLIKRVAATAGDTGRVPAGQVELLGDNAAASFDSRQIGFFPAERVIAVVVARLRQGRRGPENPPNSRRQARDTEREETIHGQVDGIAG
ncbi:S26 family signal peptidase [Nonomuraea purpurea]|uniref:S26 family signal peptidase n=1 Tax=Nonomuraea purpurea TaxID=1849276 RepID=A0ABV8GQ38_9ACTN